MNSKIMYSETVPLLKLKPSLSFKIISVHNKHQRHNNPIKINKKIIIEKVKNEGKGMIRTFLGAAKLGFSRQDFVDLELKSKHQL